VDEATKAIQVLRDFSCEIHPAFLERMDLEQAMRWKSQQIRHSYDVAIQCKDCPDWEPMPLSVKRNAYLIFQETLTNAAKHASGEIKVRLKGIGEHAFEMEVSDRGLGFDAAKVAANSKGLGLSIMQERAARIHRDLQITSAPGKGTSVKLGVPRLP